jgi:hypothetical protein
MKCDTDPIACQPCRSKNLRCFTTDRVTGQARERGQTDRTENEVMYLQSQLHHYRTKYGPLEGRSLAPYPTADVSQPSRYQIPSSRYVGWPAPDEIEAIERGPVHGTNVNILDGFVDVADFECEQMQEPQPGEIKWNASRGSIVSSIFGLQSVTEPELPPREEALQSAEQFLVIMSQYVPVLHRPSFKAMVSRRCVMAVPANITRSLATMTIPKAYPQPS